MTQPGIEPQSPGPLANTLLIVYNTYIKLLKNNVCYTQITMPLYLMVFIIDKQKMIKKNEFLYIESYCNFIYVPCFTQFQISLKH